ncbi:hypothetical protein B0H14DRAFT_2637836 [Mycena olivaceomarginata]|nr:hypothetical protein B0H14DRAFT_2637836 [Mycena olivaceomarginata]
MLDKAARVPDVGVVAAGEEPGTDDFPALLECQLLDPVSAMNAAPDIRQKHTAVQKAGSRLSGVTKPTLVNRWPFLRNDMSNNYIPDLDGWTEGPTVQSMSWISDEDDGSEASDLDAASCITVGKDGGDLEDKFYMQEDWEVGRDEALAILINP